MNDIKPCGSTYIAYSQHPDIPEYLSLLKSMKWS